ncbi:MAG: hypothetical protein IJ773_12610 [Lachnospiraceae bacterium]|nr:hypothetical protein [Lachnospiraceae bacterium]
MRVFWNRKKTLMSEKYMSMLLGGTLTMMVVSALLMSDSVIAGAVIGSHAVAGITLVTPLYSLAAFFGSVFSLGVPIVYSTEMGKFNKKEADHAFGFGLLMALVVGVALFVLVSLFGDAYLRSSGPLAAVLEEARGYLFWMRFTILLLPMQMLIAAAVYSDGDETLSTVANGVQGLGNIVASILLSRHMGVRGIGLASFLFNVVALAILLLHFLKKSNSLRWNVFFSADMLKKVVRYSIIDSSSYLFLAALTAVLNAFVSACFGADYLIVVSVIALCREMQMVFDGIGEAITPLLSVYLGEGSLCGIASLYRLARKTAILEGLLVTLALLLLAPVFPGILGIAGPEMAACVIGEIRLVALGSVFVSLLYLLTSYYLVIERIGLGLMASALRDVALAALLAVSLGRIWGLTGMFLGLALAPAGAFVLLWLYITRRYGREAWPLFLPTLGSTPSFLYDLSTEPEQIIDLQKKVETLLTEKGYAHRTIGRVKLLIEEVYMLIREKNGGKAVLSECSVLLKRDGIQIIIKDDGVLFDISEEDVTVTSLVSLMVSGYMEKLGQNKRHLTTISFNRSSFLIKA